MANFLDNNPDLLGRDFLAETSANNLLLPTGQDDGSETRSTAVSNVTHDEPGNSADDVQHAGSMAGKIPITEDQDKGTDENSQNTDYGRLPRYDNSWGNQLATSMGHAFVAVLAGKNMGEAMAIGSAAVQDLDNKAWRSKYAAKNLVGKGASIPALYNYIEKGDTTGIAQDNGYTTIDDPNNPGHKIRVKYGDWVTAQQNLHKKPELHGDSKSGFFYLDENNKPVMVKEGTGDTDKVDVTVDGKTFKVSPDKAAQLAADQEKRKGTYQPIQLKDGQSVSQPGDYAIQEKDGTTSHVHVSTYANGNLKVTPFSEKEESSTEEGANRAKGFSMDAQILRDKGNALFNSGKLHYTGPGWGAYSAGYTKDVTGGSGRKAVISDIQSYNDTIDKVITPVMMKMVGSQRAFKSEFDKLGGSTFEKLDGENLNSEENHARIKRNDARLKLFEEAMKPTAVNHTPLGGNSSEGSAPAGAIGTAKGIKDGTVSKDGKTVVRNGYVYPNT